MSWSTLERRLETHFILVGADFYSLMIILKYNFISNKIIIMKPLLLSVFVFLSLSAFSQAYNAINPNQVKTGMHSNGSMFMDKDFQESAFNVPYSSEFGTPTAFFAGGIWLGGLDPAGNLKLSTITYHNPSFGGNDYTAGPYNASDFNFNFEKVWKVSINEINAHLEDFEDGSIDDTPADNVLEWPGLGNPNYSESFPNQRMAPFFDQNQDGIYNAYDGDYPVLEWPNGPIIPNEMIYTVYYNELSANSNTTATNLEVHSLMYGFASGNDDAVDNTLFNQLTVINRGQEALQDFKFTYWTDPDLGCHLDDYTGCDPDRNTMFVYNGDQEDGDVGTSCPFGILTYGDQPPVISVTFLNQDLSSFMVYYNAGMNNVIPATSDPQVGVEYFNLMNGLWKGNTPLSIGGNGYNPGSTDVTKYAFHDNPNDPDGWSMFAEDLPFNDFRTMSTISKDVLQPGETMTIDVAITSTNNTGSNHVEQVDEALLDVDYIQGLYNDGIISSTKQISSQDQVFLSPNPNDGTFTLEGAASFDHYCVTDVMGKQVQTGAISSKVISLGLSPNVYFIHLMSHDSEIRKSLKLVVLD